MLFAESAAVVVDAMADHYAERDSKIVMNPQTIHNAGFHFTLETSQNTCKYV